MRRGQVGLLLIVTSGLFSVLLAVAVNVATGGQLPVPLKPYAWLAWPMVGLLALTGIGLALWQQRLIEHTTANGVGKATTVEVQRPAELPGAPVLFGRDEDLATVERAISGGARVVVLSAAPGTGKTSLALRVAHDARSRYPDGQLYAAMLGASAEPVPPEAVLSRFLGALGRPEDERRGSVEELAARFRSAVADRKVLVLLDDARDSAQIRPLLPGGAACLTVVTSRRLLADLPGALPLTIGGLRPEEALALLAATAGEERIAADPEGARRIVEACAGLPLAIRIVGGRLRARPMWTPSALAARLDDEQGRLDELRLGDRAVRSSFRTAYDELSQVEQRVFRRAGAHPGQVFGLGAAAARCGLDEASVSGALDRLTDAFLIEAPAPDRYRLHDLLRLFAMEMLDTQETPTERAACLTREIQWLTSHARPGPWLADERDNVLSVLRAALEMDAADLVWALVDAVHPLLTVADDPSYHVRLWQAGEAAAAALGDDVRRVRALRLISHSYGMAGQVLMELPPAQQAVALAEQLNNPGVTAQALRRLGEAMRAQNRYPEAEAALIRALDLFTSRDSAADEIEVRAALGNLYNMLGRTESSLPMLQRAAELLPPREASIHGWVLLGLGLAYRFDGQWAESAAHDSQAFDTAQRLGDDYLLGYCFQARGWHAEHDGRYADAEHDFREMLAIFTRIRHGSGAGGALEALGTIAGEVGRREAALASFDAAIAQYDRLGDRVRAGQVRIQRSMTLGALGRDIEATQELQLARTLIGDAPIHRGPALPERIPVGHTQDQDQYEGRVS